MVTELKERQEKQVTPASREETINRLDVIEQCISEMQGKSGIPENTVQKILNQISNIRKGQSENQKQDLEDIKGLIVTSHRYFMDVIQLEQRVAELAAADAARTKKHHERHAATPEH